MTMKSRGFLLVMFVSLCPAMICDGPKSGPPLPHKLVKDWASFPKIGISVNARA